MINIHSEIFVFILIALIYFDVAIVFMLVIRKLKKREADRMK